MGMAVSRRKPQSDCICLPLRSPGKSKTARHRHCTLASVSFALEIAAFAMRASDRDLSDEARRALKLRIIDSIACAIGASKSEPIGWIRAQVDDFGGRPLCTLIGGGRSAPDRAAFYNGALVRYLDYNDSYLAPRETCHPSDNFSSVLAAAEYAGATGRTLLAALAVAYQVQCRLSDEAPVRDRGFDHVTQGACAVAAGVSRALGLDEERAANAIAMATTALNSLRVTRTGALSHWKGLAYPHTAFAATHAAFLAARGMTGPPLAFEGNKGWMETVSGPFSIDWQSEGLERVTRTAIKRYNAEIHAQSSVEAVLEIVAEIDDLKSRVQRIEVDIFDVAHRIIGGGEEGDKTNVVTREQADHSLPYMLAVAVLDGKVEPEQYTSDRIGRSDVQTLLKRVTVRPDPALSARFPIECPCRVRVVLDDGQIIEREKADYLGYPTRPMSESDVEEKFNRLTSRFLEADEKRQLIQAILDIEHLGAAELGELLLGGASPNALAPEPLTSEVQP